jgi:hypothetical protein
MVGVGSEHSDGAVPEISEAVVGSCSSSMSSAIMLEGMVAEWVAAVLIEVGTTMRFDIGPLEEAIGIPIKVLGAVRRIRVCEMALKSMRKTM